MHVTMIVGMFKRKYIGNIRTLHDLSLINEVYSKVHYLSKKI